MTTTKKLQPKPVRKATSEVTPVTPSQPVVITKQRDFTHKEPVIIPSHLDEIPVISAASYIKDILGVEVLSDTLKENDGDLDAWKNDLTWTFIELVAMQVVDEKEEQELNDDRIIEGYNPSRSMTETRYAQV